MPSGPDRPGLGAIAARALLYALIATAIVLWMPGRDYVFIYQGF
ncbi:MAG TPA: hypothetical protein VGR62_19425 [Candidatus Binatia bacterium]|jgi:hypothetical protein|nr:hypothetical protein [Candidatus Binatia bacterium]